MPKIETITKYKFKGKEYNSLKEIQDAIHNTIGEEVLDKINRVCPPEQHKNLFKILDLLCSKEVRAVLMDCYSVTYEDDSNGFEDTSETINILDTKFK